MRSSGSFRDLVFVMRRRTRLLISCGLVALGGCSSEKLPRPAAIKSANEPTFQIHSLTANGRNLDAADGLTFSPAVPVKFQGEILFNETPPDAFLVRFIEESDGRTIIANEGIVLVDPPPPGSSRLTKFEQTVNAPADPGKYVLQVIAFPPKSQRKDGEQPAPPQIYAVADVTVEG